VQLARRRVRQNLRPDRLGLAHDDGVSVLERLLRTHGRMDAAKDHGLARAAVRIRDFVGAAGLDGHGRDADQIGLDVRDADGIAQVLLHDGDVVLGRRDRRQQLKRGAFDLSPTQPNGRVRIRIDELDFHCTYTILAGEGRR
jgi:hypothetical protein